jgi:hypothetical protein
MFLLGSLCLIRLRQSYECRCSRFPYFVLSIKLIPIYTFILITYEGHIKIFLKEKSTNYEAPHCAVFSTSYHLIPRLLKYSQHPVLKHA